MPRGLLSISHSVYSGSVGTFESLTSLMVNRVFAINRLCGIVIRYSQSETPPGKHASPLLVLSLFSCLASRSLGSSSRTEACILTQVSYPVRLCTQMCFLGTFLLFCWDLLRVDISDGTDLDHNTVADVHCMCVDYEPIPL